MSISLSFEDKAEIGVLEYDQIVIEINHADTASERAVLTVRTSATRVEPAWLRFKDIDRETPEIGSLMTQPNPPSCVAKLHAASTKHCGSVGKVMGWLDLLVVIGREKGALHCWAFCHGRASLIDKVATSCSESRTFSKHNLFLAVHRYQRTQGDRAASSMSCVAELTLIDDAIWRAGMRFHTRLAKGHSRKKWRSVSCCPQCLHLISPERPLPARFNPTGMAPFLIFQRRCFSFGEVLTFKMHASRLNSKLGDSELISGAHILI